MSTTLTDTPAEAKEAKVIKVGNSYGIRLPAAHMERYHIKPGSYVPLPRPRKNTDTARLARQKAALDALAELARTKGPIKSIPDPVARQRKLRSEWDERETQQRATTRH